MNIPLGYEVGSGRPVSVPLGHLVVTGQSQESGKTTTLEALITRSGLRAVAFVTKRGEKSFRLMTPIRPYFRERADWQFVQALFEAALHQKQDYKQAWIMRACEGAKTLADVQANCQRALRGDKKEKIKPARGLNADMYYVLGNYFEQILPEVRRLGGSPELKLARGINVMDLAAYSFSMQALVIRSVLEHIYLQETGVVAIIPEAWEFVPRGRRSPVKLAAEEYHRKAAANRNYLWLDSQDLAGIDRNVLRSAKVWIFGVQRDQHEIKRTLESIPDMPRPNPREIATLGKGQFIVAFGESTRRVYVQPAGMEDAQAQAIARGDEPAESWGRIVRALDKEEKNAAEQATGRNDETGGVAADPAGGEGGARDGAGNGGSDRRVDDGVAVEDTGKEPDADLGISAEGAASEPTDPADADSGDLYGGSKGEHTENWPEWPNGKSEGDEAVWKEKYEQLEASYGALARSHDALVSRVTQFETICRQRGISFVGNEHPSLVEKPAAGASTPTSTGWKVSPGPFVADYEKVDDLYGEIKRRAQEDPGVLQLLTTRPELRVTVQRQELSLDGGTLRGKLALLLSKGFFDQPQNGNTAFNEMKRLGFPCAKPNVYRELDKLAELGFVTKEDSGYQAVPDMKRSIVTESRKTAVAS